MTQIPSLNYPKDIHARQRDGSLVVKQKESHLRFQKHSLNEALKLVVPAYKPIKQAALAHIFKQVRVSVDKFLKLVRRVRFQP